MIIDSIRLSSIALVNRFSFSTFFTAKILLFYVAFYAVLAGFFAAMLAVFWQTLDQNKPKWQLDDGLIGSNPGLGFRPMPPESNVESTLVWFEASNEKNTEYWIGALDEFLLSKFWVFIEVFNFSFLWKFNFFFHLPQLIHRSSRKTKRIALIATKRTLLKTERCAASMCRLLTLVSAPMRKNTVTLSHRLVSSWNSTRFD